jgi:hypothetical protein
MPKHHKPPTRLYIAAPCVHVPTMALGTFDGYSHDGRLAKVRMPNGYVRAYRRESVRRTYR